MNLKPKKLNQKFAKQNQELKRTLEKLTNIFEVTPIESKEFVINDTPHSLFKQKKVSFCELESFDRRNSITERSEDSKEFSPQPKAFSIRKK